MRRNRIISRVGDGIQKNFWTTERDAILRARYSKEGATRLAPVLGTYSYKVTRRAQQLGLHVDKRLVLDMHRRWNRR